MSTDLIIKLSLFLIISTLLAYLSRASFRAPTSHGFFRFFAWEFILALFLLNVDTWFRDPFSSTQLISWLLLLISALLVLGGVRLLRVHGRAADKDRLDAALIGIEKTTALVRVGPYRYIRHPLYSSLLFLAWGIFFKSPGPLPGLVGVIATGFLVATAKADEAECVEYFGHAYKDYMGQTKMFIPFIV